MADTSTAWADSTLAIMAEGWAAYQEQLIAALAPLDAEQLDLRVTPGLRSIREIATHLVRVRASWFKGALGVGDDAFAAIQGWQQPDAPQRTAAELVEGLRATWAVMEQAMRGWSPADLAVTVTGHYRGEEFSYVRGWVVWHVIEHDTHHGGEISYALGMHGLPGVDI
ncbi:MAG TPA: DinB family protein [Ktedonobacterales bacterium]